jgi:hypothetical protein
MKELLMLNDTLMKCSTHFFVTLAPAEERFGYFMQDDASPHTQLTKLSEHWAVCLGNLMGIELLAMVCGPLDPQI